MPNNQILDHNGKIAPKTAIMHLYNKRNKEKMKKKPSNYTTNTSEIKKRDTKGSNVPKMVANAPRA